MQSAFLALFWLFIGACVFFLFGERDRPRNGLVPYPLTTLALVFAFFNLIRWWASRLTGGGRGTPRRDWVRPPLRRPGDDVITPDPTFNFTDEPASKPQAPPAIPPSPGANGSPGTEKH